MNITRERFIENEVYKGYEELSQAIEDDHAIYCFKELINSNSVSKALSIEHSKIVTGFRNSIINVVGEFGAVKLEQITNNLGSYYLEVPAWILYLSSSREQLEIDGVKIDPQTLMEMFRTNPFYKSLSDEDIILHIEYVLRQMSGIEHFVDTINEYQLDD